MVANVTISGSIVWDTSGPDAQDEKLLDLAAFKVRRTVREGSSSETKDVTLTEGAGELTFTIADITLAAEGTVDLILPSAMRLGDGSFRHLGTDRPLEIAAKKGDATFLPPIHYQPGRFDIRVRAQFEDPKGLLPEEAMPGVPFLLFEGTAAGGQYHRKATTDHTGVAVFSDLEPNLYTLRALAQAHEGRAVEPVDPAAGYRFISVASGQPADVAEFTFKPMSTVVTGSVLEAGGAGVAGVEVLLAKSNRLGASLEATTDAAGDYVFSDVEPGHYTVMLGEKIIRPSPPAWEPDPASGASRPVHVLASGATAVVPPFVIRPEVHRIFGRIRTAAGRPADGAVITFCTDDGHFLESVVANPDGTYEWFPPHAGTFRVRAELGPTGRLLQVRRATVNSETEVNIDESPDARPIPAEAPQPGEGGSDGAIATGIADLTSYPQLGVGVGFTAGPSQGAGGGSAVQRVENAIRDVLGWRPKEGDSKGYLAALTQAFTPVEHEGGTTWKWTPRSYHVQADMGKITGAQASIYARAQAALDQSLPLLDGLRPLDPSSDDENLEAVRAVVRSDFSALVRELGEEGGPRVARVDVLFDALIGEEPAAGTAIDPAEVAGELGDLQGRFGLDRDRVNTVDEEQNLTNFLIIVDHVRALRMSWLANRAFFVAAPGTEPFFGTQLVLVSRALAVAAESVGEVFYVMDSVFLRSAERQTTRLIYPNGTPPIFLESLLTWAERAAADELPSLIQEGGKIGARAAVPTLQKLATLVQGALLPAQQSPTLPAGYKTARVQRAMSELAAHLQAAADLAGRLSEPNGGPGPLPPPPSGEAAPASGSVPFASIGALVDAVRGLPPALFGLPNGSNGATNGSAARRRPGRPSN